MGMLTDNLRAIREQVAKLHKPKPFLNVSDWAERNIYIPAAQGTAIPGRLNLDHTPYQREILNRVLRPDCRQITLMTAAGVGKSTALVAFSGYYLVQRPRRILFGRDSKASIQKFIKLDWWPIVESSPELARRAPKGKKRSLLIQEFDGASLTFTGMKSAGSLAGDTVHIVINDEADKNIHGAGGGREASPNMLIKHRNARSDDPKTIVASTPTTPDGDIYYDFCLGTQEHYHVPCPHCLNHIELVFEQFRFEHLKESDGQYDQDRVRREAFYECQRCAKKIEDRHKPDILLKGIWVPAPFAERMFVGEGGPQRPAYGHSSFYLPNWYAPWLQNSFGEVSVRYINSAATGLWSKVRDFENSVKGLPYNDLPTFKTSYEDTAITAGYKRGDRNAVVEFKSETINPDGTKTEKIRKVDLSTYTGILAVDVQGYGFKWTASLLDTRGEWFVIDHGLASDFGTLDRIKLQYKLPWAICDIQSEIEGKQAVKEAVYARSQQGWMASELQAEQDQDVVLKPHDPYKGSSLQGRHKMASLWSDGYTLKTEVDAKRHGKGLVPFWIYREDREGAEKDDNRNSLLRELFAEKRVPKKKSKAGSRHSHEYKKSREDNHYWDCMVMTLAMWLYLTRSRLLVPPAKKAAGGVKVVGEIKHSS